MATEPTFTPPTTELSSMAAPRILPSLKVFQPEITTIEMRDGHHPLKTFTQILPPSSIPLKLEIEILPDKGPEDDSLPLGFSSGLRLRFFLSPA